ncbi:unnamed protein product [Coffea canephora]|uniref:Uncharacterized protein n=1 Tax=Coffea canephora TaxID=49390 RepID=A0A068U1K5_COFCA|nr:unnamed protein product [Coffea canephora]
MKALQLKFPLGLLSPPFFFSQFDSIPPSFFHLQQRIDKRGDGRISLTSSLLIVVLCGDYAIN